MTSNATQYLKNDTPISFLALIPSRFSMMMASTAEVSYTRLSREIESDGGDSTTTRERPSSKNPRLRRLRMGRKVRVKKLLPRCKNLLGEKPSLVKIVWSKICERLKESHSRFGDIFAGNYVFMHVTPSPIKYATTFLT